MVKGFIFFRTGKIPFVIENYRMDLFTDDSLLEIFCKEYNFKENYILQGQCFDIGPHGRKATFLVENSMGSTCYLRCYIVYTFNKDETYDRIGIQSPSLDAVFGYEHKYIEMVRSGINLALEPKKVYTIPFDMNKQKYELIFQIGHNHRLGLLEDFDRKGELILPLHTNEIQECYDIAIVLCRLAMFMTSHTDILFKRITLYRKEVSVGWFYCPFISEDAVDRYNGLFYEFDIMKYIPKLLNNIALDSGNKITQSIPLGHLGNFDSMFTPQRFVEQIVAFEYLFDKLEHKKAQNLQFPLKKELEYMFNEYPQLLSQTNLSAEKVSNQIKEIRRTIAHGYFEFYAFLSINTFTPQSFFCSAISFKVSRYPRFSTSAVSTKIFLSFKKYKFLMVSLLDKFMLTFVEETESSTDMINHPSQHEKLTLSPMMPLVKATAIKEV